MLMGGALRQGLWLVAEERLGSNQRTQKSKGPFDSATSSERVYAA